ncbi:MAG: DMT family transporter [Desulfobacterales bacterium]|nr:DMT family transporter [Desulfobacterales bacterium]
MLGAFLSLCAAFFWAGSVILFKLSGKTLSPVSLNLFKSLVAFILISLTMLILSIDFFPARPVNDWLWLALSGVIGITLSDLLFFTALNRLGAGMTAIVECLYLPSVIFFSFLLLNENLTPNAFTGGFLVFVAVIVGSLSKKSHDSKHRTTVSWSGIFIGAMAMVSIAVGIVIIKELLADANVFWATLVRVTAAVISLSAIVSILPKRTIYLKELRDSKAWIYAIPASVCGNYIALLCWVGGMKYTTASKAAILNQMSTIFIFILAAVFLKEKITPNRLAAICLAVTGACLTIWG